MGWMGLWKLESYLNQIALPRTLLLQNDHAERNAGIYKLNDTQARAAWIDYNEMNPPPPHCLTLQTPARVSNSEGCSDPDRLNLNAANMFAALSVTRTDTLPSSSNSSMISS